MLLTEAGTLATNTPYQPVATKAGPAGALRWQSVGTTQQPVLAKTGDDQRIDWGQAYLSAPAAVALAAGNPQALKATFAKTGALGAGAPASLQGQAQRVALAAVLNLGQAAATPAQQHVLLGYDVRRAVLEGPFVRRHAGKYYCFFSGANFLTDRYGVEGPALPGAHLHYPAAAPGRFWVCRAAGALGAGTAREGP